MWANVKKWGLSLSVIVLFALYALQEQAVGGRSIVAALSPPPIMAGDPPTATSYPVFTQTKPTAPAQVEKTPTVFGLTRAVSTATPTRSAILPTVTSTEAPVAQSAVTATVNGAYRDGTYTGIQADALWGTVEVRAIISNGQISDVQFMQYPNHRSLSREINQQAMPILTQEAIQAQQADVDIVSGATDTSEAFFESLDSALRQAAA
jgi:uncharacterized protein with FMN-binding domain